MFSLAHFFLRCCHTFFTSALGLLPWTSTLQEWCKSEKFWKFQILIKFKFKLNIIFSEKIWKVQKKSENFRFSEKNEKFRKIQKISDFQKKCEKIWKKHKESENFRFSENLKNSDSQKKMKIRFSEKIWKIQKKSEKFRFSEKKHEKFRENLKISDFQGKKNQKKTENFKF